MSYGNLAPWLRRTYGRDARFATGSMVFDMHRHAHREAADKGQAAAPPTRLFAGL